jgi:hypothetical protein
MMFKIKQTNCLFVNFNKKKEKKLNEIGNISFFFFFFYNKKKKKIHAYIQTDRNLFRQRKNAQ